ncbi:MAG TPA: hypothetical protein DEO86_11170, partial [Colwellia sp.]|nr:hypothetical protein [Colwellia sp.]
PFTIPKGGKGMKTNISIELNDEDRNRLNNICFNTSGKKLITRKEVTSVVNLFIQELLQGEAPREVTKNIIKDGCKYYFNDVEVTPEEHSMGIHAWINKRNQARAGV